MLEMRSARVPRGWHGSPVWLDWIAGGAVGDEEKQTPGCGGPGWCAVVDVC